MMRVLAFGGYTNSGKSTIAKWVLETYGEYFAKPPHIKTPMMAMAKVFIEHLGTVPGKDIIHYLDGDLKETPIPGYPQFTGKLLQQVIGKDFRDGIDPTGEIFVHLWALESEHQLKHAKKHALMESLRFPLELNYMQRSPIIDPITVWIEREGCGPQTSADYEPRLPTKYDVDNNGPLERTFLQIKNIIDQEGLLNVAT